MFVSGQIGITPLGDMPDDFSSQAKNALFNVKAIVEAAGSRLDRILKITIYLTDLNNLHEMNIAFGRFFRGGPPAREIVEVKRLKKDAKIQISAEAFIRLDA